MFLLHTLTTRHTKVGALTKELEQARAEMETLRKQMGRVQGELDGLERARERACPRSLQG